MYSISNYNRCSADDLDLSQMGEYYLKYIAAKMGNKLIYVNQDNRYYYYKYQHKNKSYSEVIDISLNDLQAIGLDAYQKFKGKNLELILLSEMV